MNFTAFLFIQSESELELDLHGVPTRGGPNILSNYLGVMSVFLLFTFFPKFASEHQVTMVFMAAELALLRAEKVERDAELARCHKRIRQLESLTKAPPQPVNLMTSGSFVMDSFVRCHMVPWPKDNRPAFGPAPPPLPPPTDGP